MEDLDKWCNFGMKYIEKLNPKSDEYWTALLALRTLTRRRVSEMTVGDLHAELSEGGLHGPSRPSRAS
jgi:hypothetical protein